MKVKVIISLKSFEPKQLLGALLEPSQGSTTKIKVPKESASFSGVSEGRVGEFEKKSESVSFSIKTTPITITQESITVSVALPTTQTHYTVLRSPHIDKKSREQFKLSVCKQLIIINTEIKHIQEKLFKLRFHEVPGVQMKVTFQTKTRFKAPGCKIASRAGLRNLA